MLTYEKSLQTFRRFMMRKKDLQALYKEVKSRPRVGRPKSTKAATKSGCRSCGKVTWKPSRSE